MTTKGELLAAFVKEAIPRIDPDRSHQRLREQGAFISVSHPFDSMRSGAWDSTNYRRSHHLWMRSKCLIPGVWSMEKNQMAADFAAANSLLGRLDRMLIQFLNLVVQPLSFRNSMMHRIESCH